MISACWNSNEVSTKILIAVGVFGFQEQTRWRNVLACYGRIVACEAGIAHFFWLITK